MGCRAAIFPSHVAGAGDWSYLLVLMQADRALFYVQSDNYETRKTCLREAHLPKELSCCLLLQSPLGSYSCSYGGWQMH